MCKPLPTSPRRKSNKVAEDIFEPKNSTEPVSIPNDGKKFQSAQNVAWNHLNRKHCPSAEPHKILYTEPSPETEKLWKCIKIGLKPRNHTSEDEVQNPHAVHVACDDKGLTLTRIVAKPKAAIRCGTIFAMMSFIRWPQKCWRHGATFFASTISQLNHTKS